MQISISELIESEKFIRLCNDLLDQIDVDNKSNPLNTSSLYRENLIPVYDQTIKLLTESPIEKYLGAALVVDSLIHDRIFSIILDLLYTREKSLKTHMNEVDDLSDRFIKLSVMLGVKPAGDIMYDALKKSNEIPELAISNDYNYLINRIASLLLIYPLGAICKKPEISGRNALHLIPQAVVDDLRIDGKGVRVDWLGWIPSSLKKGIIVECDGYQFHSNKIMFSSDRKRMRELQKLGYGFISFSGSEINSDPLGCANEVFQYAQSYFFEEKLNFYPKAYKSPP